MKKAKIHLLIAAIGLAFGSVASYSPPVLEDDVGVILKPKTDENKVISQAVITDAPAITIHNYDMLCYDPLVLEIPRFEYVVPGTIGKVVNKPAAQLNGKENSPLYLDCIRQC